MWKLVIADDEPKIRRGIRKIINWSDYNIDIVGEAEDGEIALKVVEEESPDIILLDINMPFLNGLNLLTKLREANNNILVIIISGYDYFSYARQALKLNVYDYVLKPVNKENMEELIKGAVKKLEKDKNENNYSTWMKKQVKENINDLKKNFFSEWLDNKLSDEEVLRELEYFNIDFENNIGIIMINIVEKKSTQILDKMHNANLLQYAICNLVEEKFEFINTKFIFEDGKNNIILAAKIDDIKNWAELSGELEDEIKKYLKCNIIIEHATISNGILKLKEVYQSMLEHVKGKKRLNPIVSAAIKYMEKNYYMGNININDIACNLEISSSYLSKMLKKETGMSFIDYLSSIRIKRAMYIMEDPTVKIYDVASLVGYNDQHYFCRAFKKVVGVSPTEYRKGI